VAVAEAKQAEGSAAAAGDPPVVAIDGLRFAWRRGGADTLRIDHLAIPCGEHVFVHGPSGCGKSTLLGVMAGVLLPHAGHCRVLGSDWRGWSGARRDEKPPGSSTLSSTLR
jgi:putative ABC transport system ATP-binding protein